MSRCGPTAGGSLLLDLTQLCTPETDTGSGGIWDNVNIPPLRHLTLINADVMGFVFLKNTFHHFPPRRDLPSSIIGLADPNSVGVGETSEPDDRAALPLASRHPLLRARWILSLVQDSAGIRTLRTPDVARWTRVSHQAFVYLITWVFCIKHN